MADKTTATKADIARRLWRQHDGIKWSRDYPPHARAVVTAVLDAIADELAAGHRVEIRGHGVYEPVEHKARTARNPYANEPVEIPARVVPRWQPGGPLREAVEAANDVSDS